jgi:hypothetical protein
MMKVYKYIVRFLCLGFLLAGLSMESWGQTTILSEGFEEAGSFLLQAGLF